MTETRELDDLNTDELVSLLRSNGVSGYSGKSKPDLIKLAEDNDLDVSDLPAEDESDDSSDGDGELGPLVQDSNSPLTQRGKPIVTGETFEPLDPITQQYVSPRPAGPGRNPGLDYPSDGDDDK
jgi:hypothetical protein